MKKKLLFDENHVMYNSDLKQPEELEKRINEIHEAKRLLIIAATDGLEPNDERVLDPLKNLTLLQDELKYLKADIEKAQHQLID